MNAWLAKVREDRTIAHVAPLLWFLLSSFLLGIAAGQIEWKHPDASWWRRFPDTWILTLQTLSTTALVAFFWKHYEFRWNTKAVLIGGILGAVGIGFWLLPTQIYEWLGLEENPEEGLLKWLGVNDRLDGFDPEDLGSRGWMFAWLAMRFFRAVVIVSIVEEVLWRSFLMRYLLKPDGNYWKVPFGKPALLSFAVVTGAFMLAHAPVDWAGAIAFGSIMYGLAVWQKSLLACVVMHGVANFLMCWYALETGKFGLL